MEIRVRSSYAFNMLFPGKVDAGIRAMRTGCRAPGTPESKQQAVPRLSGLLEQKRDGMQPIS